MSWCGVSIFGFVILAAQLGNRYRSNTIISFKSIYTSGSKKRNLQGVVSQTELLFQCHGFTAQLHFIAVALVVGAGCNWTALLLVPVPQQNSRLPKVIQDVPLLLLPQGFDCSYIFSSAQLNFSKEILSKCHCVYLYIITLWKHCAFTE